MRTDIYRYVLSERIPVHEAEATLQLAVIAAEGLYGQARVRLDARYAIDDAGREIVVHACNEVGACICRVFTGYLACEFGEDAFQVRPVCRQQARPCSHVPVEAPA